MLRLQLKKEIVVLLLILAAFVAKGLFQASILPVFFGEDEEKHYSTIQYLAEPKEKNWPLIKSSPARDIELIETLNVTEEIRETAFVADFNAVRRNVYNTQEFARGLDGPHEAEINANKWKSYNEFTKPKTVKKPHFYHYLGSLIEKTFSDENVLVRFYLIRIFAVMVGALSLVLMFLIFINIGLGGAVSLLVTATIALHPLFVQTASLVNYDILVIFAFTLFTLAGVLMVKAGINWKNMSLMIISIIIALITKGTGIVIAVSAFPFLAFLLSRQYGKINRKYVFLLILILIAAALIVSSSHLVDYNLGRIMKFGDGTSVQSAMSSLDHYIKDSLAIGRIKLGSNTYWANHGWTNAGISEMIIYTVWLLNTLAALGMLLYLILPKKRDFLPEKKYIFFLLYILLMLRLGTHFFDWRVFDTLGGFQLGTPGRYFLPNISSHFAVVFTGIGYYFSRENHFKNAARILFLLVLLYSLYETLFVIIPRYYL